MPRQVEIPRELRQRQEKLSALAAHPGFEELKEVFKARKEKHLREIALDIMGEGVDQRKVDRIKGFWLGCSWLLANPTMAEDTLKKALAAATVMEEDVIV